MGHPPSSDQPAPAEQASTDGQDAPRNQHIDGLGFGLRHTTRLDSVRPLLDASGVDALPEQTHAGPWAASTYLVARTTAGGAAACVGWARGQGCIVLHSLAVAAPSRGSGIGASMLATVLGQIMDDDPVEHVYLTTRSARHFFVDFGFKPIDSDQLPYAVQAHPVFAGAPAASRPMVRSYRRPAPGLDQCAFRLIHNTTADAALPAGSVFLFHQAGSILQADYRGKPVQRGHLIGSITNQKIIFRWHHALTSGQLDSGRGHIVVDELDDGRRELREKLGRDPGELLLREV